MSKRTKQKRVFTKLRRARSKMGTTVYGSSYFSTVHRNSDVAQLAEQDEYVFNTLNVCAFLRAYHPELERELLPTDFVTSDIDYVLAIRPATEDHILEHLGFAHNWVPTTFLTPLDGSAPAHARCFLTREQKKEIEGYYLFVGKEQKVR